MVKLREKQKRFADEYIRLGNATEAARLANYKQPHVQGSRLLENVSVKAYISERLAEMDSDRIMDAQEALELITSIARGELNETAYIASGEGVAEIEKPPDINQRKDAAKEILKRFPIDKDSRERLIDAQIRKVVAEAMILENKANKLSIKENQKAHINDLIDIGKSIIGGDDG